MNLKISVLSSGAVLLDGKPVDLAQLDEALRAGKETNATVLTLVAEAVRKRGWQLWAIDPRGIGELETPKSGRAFTVSLLRGENFVWRQGWDIRRILDLAATATP